MILGMASRLFMVRCSLCTVLICCHASRCPLVVSLRCRQVHAAILGMTDFSMQRPHYSEYLYTPSDLVSNRK